MKTVRFFLFLLLALLLPTLSFAGTLTASSAGYFVNNEGGDGYYVTYYVTLTQIDADPSDDTHTIPSDAWKMIEGGIGYAFAVASSTAGADVGITVSTTMGSNNIEWFDQEFTQASLPYAQSGDATFGAYFPIIGSALIIGADTDWADDASGDSITVYLTVFKEEN